MPLSEADTRAELIDPAIHKRGWTEDLICREETAGSIEILGGKARRRARGRVDYVLRVKVNPNTQPVAVALIEAKKDTLPPGHGLDQGKGYAACKRLQVPFVISSNGHLFVLFDRFSGLTSSPRSMAEFPTPEELRGRYEQGMGFSLEAPAARPLLIPYTGGEATRRYYQDAAIRAVLEKIARGEQTGESRRALLSLATGAGKTFIAVNLLLVSAGYSPNVLRLVEDKGAYDLYDVLAELGWGMNPRTREDRTLAFRYKHEDWLNTLPAQANATIRAIAGQFAQGGTEGLENPHIFQTPAVRAAGGLEALKLAGVPAELLRQTKVRMFAA